MSEVRRLILWDVDGTLIRSDGVGAEVMMEAARSVTGLDQVPQVAMGGCTDPQILRSIFTAAELAEDRIEEILPSALAKAEQVMARVEHQLRARGRALPGVPELLERLGNTPGVRQTLVTGNVAPNAAVKVAAFGLTEHFDVEVGAYGSDHADRNELVPLALRRVEELRGERYDPATEVWVVGDTVHDLACARAGGSRCLLVGTGATSPEDLEAVGADAHMADLSDVTAALAVLTG